MTREPAVAGTFYPAEKERLAHLVERFLDRAREVEVPGGLKGVIVPHAGYVFSGPVAATGFKLVQKQHLKNPIVILTGASHQAFFEGLVFPEYTAFETPLGKIQVEESAREILKKYPEVVISDIPHKFEHSLEVELPFLQKVISSFTIVPLLFGEGDYHRAGEILVELYNQLPSDRQLFLVVSTDLSHYQTYLAAKELDSQTCRAIVSLQPERIPLEGACGRRALQAILVLAQKAGWKIQLLDCRNSGDITGNKIQVVGYAAFAIFNPKE